VSGQAELPIADHPAARPTIRSLSAVAAQWIVRIGDRLNPILVKETRQALKSRQFGITFGLVLLCGWVWSIVGVAMAGPHVFYGVHGPDMFFGYYVILAFPLLVIVPFGAFRSLAGEQEDRTYELLSITALGPRQIVGGKLGSAGVQMAIYLSAVSPCLAFTYMLRGIDFPTILFILLYTVLGSLALSVAALLVGTLTAEKHWQVVLSVLSILGLVYAFGGACALVMETLNWADLPFGESEFWQVNGAFLTAYVTYFALLFYAASAQLTFVSDNRSTRLRFVMLIQHVLCVGWMSWFWIGPARGEEEVLLAFMILIGLHWYVMGAFMIGESPDLSPRVKRRLPQSFLGRVFLTWFNPGPGTGYLLAVSGLLAALLMVVLGVAAQHLFESWNLSRWSSRYTSVTLAFGLLGASYATIYLGLGLLVIRFLRRITQVGILLNLLIHVLLLMLGSGVPVVIQLMSPEFRYLDYTLLQITNPLWTLAHVADRSNLPAEAAVLLLLIPFTAAIVFLLTLPGVAREVRQVRVAKPKRVAEEDAELTPVRPVKTSPWDN